MKGVGESAVLNIIEERKKNGPYKNIFDFVERVNLTACNKKNIESLALAGAFDNFGIQREQFFAETGKGEVFLDTLVRYGNKFQMDKTQQPTLCSAAMTCCSHRQTRNSGLPALE